MINQKEWAGVSDTIKDLAPQEFADIISLIWNYTNKIRFFKTISDEVKSKVFPYLQDDFQELLLEKLSLKTVKHILLNLEPDDRTAILEYLHKDRRIKLLKLLPQEELKESKKLLSYPEESIGRLMTPEFVAVSPNWKIRYALNYIRKVGQDKETISTIYVVDKYNNLIDDIRLRKLILASPEKKIENIMDNTFVALNAYSDREEAVKLMKKYDQFALPVVDNGVLVGIVTFDDVFDVAEEEITEDIHKQSGVTPFEINYMSASIFEIYKSRVGWLLLLLVGSFISTSIIAHFSFAIESVVALSFFIAVLIGSGGNVGTQSSALIIRAMAIGDFRLIQWKKLFIKELIIGALLGLSLGLALYIRAYLMKGARVVSYVASVAIFFVVVWANLIGAILPLVLKKIKMDPAVVSSPLITTIIDSSGLMIYFLIAKLILKF
ncbi:MAG: magnesium transporter [Spirochaetes bacterium]|nr:magnesium transporter [Spirochaetota bacterium]